MRNINWKHVSVITVLVTGAVVSGFLELTSLSSILGGAAMGWSAAIISNGRFKNG